MLSFLRTVVFIVGAYYVIRFLVKVFTATRRQSAGQHPPKDGTVNYAPGRKKTGGNGGEYIEYEEVE